MTHVITTYGGGELFKLVFDGIAALFNTKNGILLPLMNMGLSIGLAYVVILMLFRHQLIDGLRWFLWVIIVTHMVCLPKTRIHIHDPLNNTHRDVANVPLALGAFASFVSHVGKTVTEKFESLFSLPDYMPYHKTGTVFASSLMSQVGQFRIIDPIFKGNMDRFVNQCVVYAAMIGNKYTPSDLQNTKDIWELVKSNASPVLGFLYKDGKTPGKIVTCQEGVKKLDDLWTPEIKRATALYGSRVQNRDITEAVFNTSLLGSARLLAGALSWAASATDILKQEMMVKAVNDASNNKLSELGSASNYAATKALLQQRSTYAVAGDIAARTLPLFKNVIEALSYALFIFVVILALLPNGYRILMTYFGILVWTQLWAPLYAVLNLIMSLYGRAETLGHGAHDGLTILNSSAIINANADMTTLAAWLSVSIPFISYGILKQGAGAFVGLAQHLGSAMQSAASGAASEAVSGNINLGNVTMGTQAYQNTTAFQHMTSPTYNASQFKAMTTSGIEQSTFADGTQALNDQGMSNLPVKLMAIVNHSYEEQQRLQEATSVAQAKLASAGEARESASQDTANVLNRIGFDVLKNKSYHDTLTENEMNALQDHNNFTNDIMDALHVSKARAHEIAVGVKVGTPDILPISASGSTNLSATTTHQDQLQVAQAIAKQKGYSYSLDYVVSGARSLLEDKNDTKGAELAKGVSASLNKAAHLSNEASIAQNNVKEISDAYASSQRRDFQESREVTQDFLEYVAHQPLSQGSSSASSETVGIMKAHAIMKEGGDAYQSYLGQFKKEHPQYAIQTVNVGREQKAIQAQYEAGSHQLRTGSVLETQHFQNVQRVENLAHQVGVPQRFPELTLEKDIEGRLKATEKAVAERKIAATIEQNELQSKVDAAKKETLIGGNLKNTWDGVNGDAAMDVRTIDPGLD